MDRDFAQRVLQIHPGAGASANADEDRVRLHELRSLFETLLPESTEDEVMGIAAIQEDLRSEHVRLASLLEQGVIDQDEYTVAINTELTWSMRRCAQMLGDERCRQLFGVDDLHGTSLIVAERMVADSRPELATYLRRYGAGENRYTPAPTERKRVMGAAKKRRKRNAAFMRPVTPDAALSEVVGSEPLPRTELTKKLWAYIKKNRLQDKKNKRMIKADANLKAVFGGKSSVNKFDMTKLLKKHLK